MVSRCIIETALVGSYLAIHGADNAQRLMKKQSNPAKRLRERFLSGDTLGALALLSEVDFITAPLSPALTGIREFRPFDQICKELDKHPPFSKGNLATLLYEESYIVFSNHVEHPTPQSLRRHTGLGIHIRGKGPRMFRPTVLIPHDDTIAHVVMPAIGALGSCIARSIGKPNAHLDQLAFEVAAADGYVWTGSPARMLATAGLANLARLPSLYALNRFGLCVRVVGTFDEMANMGDAEQLIVSSELLDRNRRGVHLLAPLLPNMWPLTRMHRPRQADQTPTIAKGQATDSPQALLAALALVYAGLWPDDAALVTSRLEDFDAGAPHAPSLLVQLFRSISATDIRRLRALRRSHALRMPGGTLRT